MDFVEHPPSEDITHILIYNEKEYNLNYVNIRNFDGDFCITNPSDIPQEKLQGILLTCESGSRERVEVVPDQSFFSNDTG